MQQGDGPVRLRRDLVRERLLQRLHVRALLVGVVLAVREGRGCVRILRERPVRHDDRRLLLRRCHLPERLLQRRHERHVRGICFRIQYVMRHFGSELRSLPFWRGMQQEHRTVRLRRGLVLHGLLQRQYVRTVRGAVDGRVRHCRRHMHRLRRRRRVLERSLHLRWGDVRGLLQRIVVRGALE
jgi:hypothetical protein